MHLYVSTGQKYNISVQHWLLHEGESREEHCTKFGFLCMISQTYCCQWTFSQWCLWDKGSN